MDRLETFLGTLNLLTYLSFTFQYGQIRNQKYNEDPERLDNIYIPVWIDQKLIDIDTTDLLSKIFTFQYGQIRNLEKRGVTNIYTQIYIPVWIDQKLCFLRSLYMRTLNLHSSMDRLETEAPNLLIPFLE